MIAFVVNEDVPNRRPAGTARIGAKRQLAVVPMPFDSWTTPAGSFGAFILPPRCQEMETLRHPRHDEGNHFAVHETSKCSRPT